jgi:hypothetical protein
MPARSHTLSRQKRIALRDDEKQSVVQAEALLFRETGEAVSLVGIKLRPMTWLEEPKLLADRYMYADEYGSLFRRLGKDGFKRGRQRAVVGRATRAGNAGLGGERPPNARVWLHGDFHVVIAEHESGPEIFIALAWLATNAGRIKDVLGMIGSAIGVVKNSVDLLGALRKGRATKATKPERHFIPSHISIELHMGNGSQMVTAIPLSSDNDENRERVSQSLATLERLVTAAAAAR